MSSTPRLLLVGNPEPNHVGAHLLRAAASLGAGTDLSDTREAFAGPAWRRRVDWWIRGRRPPRLREFSARVTALVREFRPAAVLATGIAPLDARALEEIGSLGVVRANYLTDDPWNPAHRAPWFLSALRAYDWAFSPRRANMADLEGMGPAVRYVPFGYAPEMHYPDSPAAGAEQVRFDVDVMFAGGADRDRIQALLPFIDAGFRVGLYGGYWDRHPRTRAHARGFLGPAELRKAVAGARMCLCLVRRANRDGHAMRTFEVAAMGGCMLVQDTPDHRELFGSDGEAVAYFTSIEQAVEKALWLLGDPAARRRLAAASHRLVTGGRHTYVDRLRSIWRCIRHESLEDRDRRPRALSRV